MPENIEQAVSEAARAGAAAVGVKPTTEGRGDPRGHRRGFTVTKFGRHESGYFHARVTVDGESFYVHAKHGSWLYPVPNSDRMQEIRSPYKEVLAEKARHLRSVERRAKGVSNAANEQHTGESQDAGSDHPPMPTD